MPSSVLVIGPGRHTLSLALLDDSIPQLRAQVARAANVPQQHLHLFLHDGKILDQTKTLSQQDVKDNDILRVRTRLVGGMPPKAKKGKKGSKGEKGKKGKKGEKGAKKKSSEGGAAGAAPSDEHTAEQVAELKAELEREREERNYFQLERDKLNTFWEISKKEVGDARATIRNKERELEELEERHLVEVKVYKQKVKHLLYEHQNSLTQLKEEGQAALKLQTEEHLARESESKRTNRTLKVELKELEMAHEESIRELKGENDKNITKLRQQYEREVRDLQLKLDRMMRLLRDDLELRRKVEILEIEERKNGHINELMKRHEKSFSEIKNYYNDITHNNLDLIRSLKEEVAEMKRKEVHSEKLMYEIAQENKRLSEPLTRALKEVEKLRHELSSYQKDKVSLQNSKSRLKVLEGQLRDLTWEHEVLEQRFSATSKERDDLYDKFEGAIYEVQQKSGFKNLVLEKKLAATEQILEKKDAQINEVLAAANLDPAMLAEIEHKIGSVIDAKNAELDDVRYELQRVSKAHNDVIRAYESKLTEFGIPVDELGFRPLVSDTGMGPAGLVVDAK